jgi:haloalkane dehalogenase
VGDLQELYPFESHFYERRGLRQHYLDEGLGDPILMLHGNPSWSFFYRDVIKAVRGSYRAIVPDHIGCGYSDKPADSRYRYTLESRVDDLEALLDHLGVSGDLTLLLHDWGGMIGMAYALRHPERIRRIALLNTAAFHLPTSTKLPLPLRIVRNTWLGAQLVLRFNAFARGATRLAVTRRPMARELRNAHCRPYDSPRHRISTLRFVQDIPLAVGDPSYDLVGRSQAGLEAGAFRNIPTLICWGMRDFVFDEHFLARWIEYWPDAEVHRFEDCGHYVLEDAPDEIIELLRDFLRRHPLSAGAPAGASGGLAAASGRDG